MCSCWCPDSPGAQVGSAVLCLLPHLQLWERSMHSDGSMQVASACCPRRFPHCYGRSMHKDSSMFSRSPGRQAGSRVAR
jgi:hypothetical protein